MALSLIEHVYDICESDQGELIIDSFDPLDQNPPKVGHLRVIGFLTRYTGGPYAFSRILYSQQGGVIDFVKPDLTKETVHFYAKKLKQIDCYQKQYGIALSVDYNCFFVTDWIMGLFCFDLITGNLKWHFRLKHARRVLTYSDYLLCEFDEIGIRKISYAGQELDRMAATTSRNFYAIEEPYFFIGPNRNMYYIIDSTDMTIYKKISRAKLTSIDGSLFLYKVTGTCSRLLISGLEDGTLFQREIEI